MASLNFVRPSLVAAFLVRRDPFLAKHRVPSKKQGLAGKGLEGKDKTPAANHITKQIRELFTEHGVVEMDCSGGLEIHSTAESFAVSWVHEHMRMDMNVSFDVLCIPHQEVDLHLKKTLGKQLSSSTPSSGLDKVTTLRV